MPSRQRSPVFPISVSIILALVAIGAAFPQRFGAAAERALDWVTLHLGWFYLVSVFGFVVVLVYLAFSKYGAIKLGKPDSEPEYSWYSWVAMLLAAGFGVGLVFYGVAEPMSHFNRPPYGMEIESSSERAAIALQYAFFDWGVHQWAAFSIVGLIIGIFQYRREQRGLVSTVLEPMTRRLPAANGAGVALDVFAVVATVMGVATSLGLGVLQVNGGLGLLYGVPENVWWQAGILAAMFAAYMTSTVLGLDRGIRVLSNINLALALALMAFVLIAGPTLTILRAIVQGLGDYLQNFVSMSLHGAPFDDATWASEWTVFYWAWVIAWSPFVGTFVARVSKGRTIREYVMGVLVMPPLLACLWIGIFGGAALHFELTADAGLAAATEENITTALFELFELLPWSTVMSVAGMALVFIFLVTSADSASYIVGQMTDRGSLDPPLTKRITWGALIAAICLTLIATGGLQGLQAAAVVAALPFTLIIYAMIVTLFRVLAEDRHASLEALYEKHDVPVAATIEEARELGD